MSEKRGGAAALVVVAAALALSGFLSLRERMDGRVGVTAMAERRPMTGVELEEVGGGTWRLSEHRGEVVAINLWATWCGPCREETPVLVRAVREMGARGFSVVGVSLDEGDREGKVKAFAERYGVNYPMALPDALSQMSAGMQGIPTTILLDREGRVAKTYVGEFREEVFRRDVAALLGER